VAKKKKKHEHMAEYPLRYPWDEWFKKAAVAPIHLTKGTDFPCQVHSMGIQVRTAAAARGLAVKVLTNDDTITVEVL